MKVHSFIKDTIAMDNNEQIAVAEKKVNYEHSNRGKTSSTASTEGETTSKPAPEEKAEETRETEKKKGQKGSRNKKDV